MEDGEHPSKKRRLENSAYTSSSSDELGGDSDVEQRKASWSKHAQEIYSTPRASKEQSATREVSVSSDELAGESHSRWRQKRPMADSPSSSRESTPQPSRQGDVSGDDNSDDGMRDRSVGRSERARTPTPPPPPPKPERLNYKEKFVLKGHQRGVSAVQFSPDGTLLASCGADAVVNVWDVATGRLIHNFEGHLAGISTIAWSPDGATIASGSDDKSIRFWNVSTGKPHPVPFLGHHNYIYSIAFSPKGNMLVSGSYDEAVFLWDVRSARVMRSLPAHSDPVAGVDVVRDGTLIASCAGDGLIRIWDSATGQCLRTLVHEDNPPVTAVKFSPNGRYVLAWTLDNCVRLWDYVEGRCIKTYQGHKNSKYSLSGGFGIYAAPGGPPNAFAVSGSEGGDVVCWDVVSKKILQTLEGHTDAVLGVDTCNAGERRLMASCSLDRTVRVWEEVPEDESMDEPQESEQGQKLSPNLQTDVDGDSTMME